MRTSIQTTTRASQSSVTALPTTSMSTTIGDLIKPWITPHLPRCIMVNLGGNTGRLNSSRLYSVWIKHGHFADAKPCGKSMDKSRRLDIAHRFATLDHPLTTLRQGEFMRKSLTKNSTTTDTNRVIFSSRNHIKTTQEIVLFPPVFCPTIGGRFKDWLELQN